MCINAGCDYTPCTDVDAWFGYGRFSLKCGCGGAPSPPPRPPPSPVAAPPPPPVVAPSPPGFDKCTLLRADGTAASFISGPIIGGQTTVYGNALLVVDGTDVAITLSLSGGELVNGDVIQYQFYTSEAAFASSIQAPGCTRMAPGKLGRSLEYSSRTLNTIRIPTSALARSDCTASRVFVVVHLPLVGWAGWLGCAGSPGAWG